MNEMNINEEQPSRPFSEIIDDYKDDAERLDSPSYYGLTCIAEQLEKSLAESRDEIDRLKAELAASEIRWTDARPTTEGWWHYRNIDTPACVLFCQKIDDQIFAHYCGGVWFVPTMLGQWSDKPIRLPKEASKPAE